ncbi:MAG: SPOR domain-containing protein [Cellvibrionaceae bacterium]|nr:SPOR domain-containing protein [Cellvibrionaceae bacterium]
MQWIVASLLALNAVVFVYFQWFADPSPASAGDESSLPLLVDDAPPLVLLGEGGDGPSANTEALSPPARPPKIEKSRSLCTLVGPFDKLLQAEYFLESLAAENVVAEIRNIIVNSDEGYWLHLAPESSRKKALRRLSELQRQGIDSYVIPSGNLANGISLGMFSRRARAQAMSDEIAKQGYKPIIIAIAREQKEIWVFLASAEAHKLSDQRWSELLSSAQYLQKRQNLCSDIASA